MNTQTINGTLVSIKRVNNSVYGNPNYKLSLETSNGHVIKVGTLGDSMVNYKIHGGLEGKQISMIVKVNRKSYKLLSFEV